MAETQTSTPKEKEEKILFYRHYFIELFRKKIYMDGESWETEEAKVEGDTYRINTDDEYSVILRSLRKKIEALKYISSDESFEALRKEIVLDITKILFKLEKGQRF